MIIIKTPLRMSYVGGGSDLSSYYLEHGGAVISSAVNKYVYVIIKKRFEQGIRLSYSITENAKSRFDIKHPYVKHALNYFDIDDDLEIVSIADIPSSGTGMGSSSSFSVGLLKGLSVYKGLQLSDKALAELACHLEIDLCGNPIGKQDQYAAVFGGLKIYEFNKDSSVSISSLACDYRFISQLNSETIAFYLGGLRDANKILKKQSEDLQKESKAKAMKGMVDLVWELRREFESNSLDNFGAILHENWLLKKSLSEGISNNVIDEIYKTAREQGATGGKLLGAGGGGFMIFHAPSDDVRVKISNKLNKLKEVKLEVEQAGASLIFYQ